MAQKRQKYIEMDQLLIRMLRCGRNFGVPNGKDPTGRRATRQRLRNESHGGEVDRALGALCENPALEC